MSDSSPSSVGRRRSSLHAASVALFGGAESPLLAAFDSDALRVVLRSGETLFRQGDVGDELYVVTHGSLEVLAEREPGTLSRLDVIGRGGVVGEMALLANEPRSATVRAIRDSELVRIDKAAFDELLIGRPAIAIDLARSLVRRLRRATSGRGSRQDTRTIAFVPVDDSARATTTELTRKLVNALARERGAGPVLRARGIAAVVDSERVDRSLGFRACVLAHGAAGETRLIEWLSTLEDVNPFVLFIAQEPESPWTARCLRQADLTLLVADAQGSDEYIAESRRRIERALSAGASGARRELVLLHGAGVEHPTGTSRWLGIPGVSAHHHVRPDRAEDVGRLARAIAGRSVGVTLSGGGARGFAHIGMLKAMREAGLPIDVVGGTSMGAIIAAQWAAGYDADDMVDLCRRHYALDSARDRTIPVASFSSARGTVHKLKSMFGDRCIEDLWTRYFAVTSSLTHAQTRVHDRGPLWLWTRVSCGIPGLVPPVAHEGELLADGGILDNLPVQATRDRCFGRIVASDVSVPVDLRPSPNAEARPVLSGWPLLWERLNPFGSALPSFPSMVDILQRTALLGSVRDSLAAGRTADLYLRPPVDEFGMTSFAAIDRLVEIGYRHAAERIEEWQILVRTGLSDDDNEQNFLSQS